MTSQNPKTQKTVRLYALSTCGWCKKTHEFLQSRNVDHGLILVDLLDAEAKARARAELVQFNPRRSYPTVVIDDRDVVTGFDEERLIELLEL